MKPARAVVSTDLIFCPLPKQRLFSHWPGIQLEAIDGMETFDVLALHLMGHPENPATTFGTDTRQFLDKEPVGVDLQHS